MPALLFPQKIDRFRLIQFLFRRIREQQPGRRQQVLGVKAGVSQASVSRLENLVIDDNVKNIQRDKLLSIICHGLNLPQDDVEALLWLYDGVSLGAFEVDRYLKNYIPNAAVGTFRSDELRQAVLSLLDRAVEHGGPHKASVEMRFKADATARLAEVKELLEYEERPGQRLFITTIPTSLVHPASAFDTGEIVPPVIKAAGCESTFQPLHKRRQELFLRNIERFGERSIHSKRALEHYVKDRDAHFTTLDQRRLQIKNWIQLLTANEHYEIGLEDEVPQLELCVKTTPVALIRGVSEDRNQKNPFWGVHHIFWRDEISVFSFILSFEQRWINIQTDHRDKKWVVKWLENLLPS
ncbi:MAG TPA: hypothetical protein VHW45_20130 [Candidatus Sulfotelmatobacter sp.]|jgi:hypothetical protein|nr:hypothetical protein [Candidatus Sulfotelmatobacter sp.]